MRITLLVCVLMLLANSAFASLSEQLVGHWQASQEGIVADYQLRGDGTFNGSLAQQGKVIWTFAGTWAVNGKTIGTELTRSSSDKIPAGTKDRSMIVELTNEVCRLKLQNGSVLKYSKVQ